MFEQNSCVIVIDEEDGKEKIVKKKFFSTEKEHI